VIIALGQDDSLKHGIEDLPSGQQICERPERPRNRLSRRRFQLGPGRRNQQPAAIRQHQDQLQPPPTAHPPDQLERPAIPRMP
jgi:hypothetical protein